MLVKNIKIPLHETEPNKIIRVKNKVVIIKVQGAHV